MDETNKIGYTFRLPKALLDALRGDAEKHSRSINQHVIDVLAAYHEGRLIDAEKLLSEPSVKKLIAATHEAQKREIMGRLAELSDQLSKMGLGALAVLPATLKDQRAAAAFTRTQKKNKTKGRGKG